MATHLKTELLVENNRLVRDNDTNEVDDERLKYAENQWVLIVTVTAFSLFAAVELVGAIASNSLSLLGDSAAMVVDVIVAERIKAKGGVITESARFMLEVYIPLISVSGILGVTLWILSESIDVLQTPSDSEDVNVNFLYGYAAASFMVDVISNCAFYQHRKNVFVEPILLPIDENCDSEGYNDEIETPIEQKHSLEHDTPFLRGRETHLNVNMAAAFTHVVADTLRTISVFLAAIVSSATGIKGSVCDACAAIGVSITILIAIVPLVREIWKSAKRKEWPHVRVNSK